MAVEIEKKYRLTPDQWTETVAALDDAGAEWVGEDLEENTIYGGGPLDAQRAMVRIRRIGSRTLLTFKRRIAGDMTVKRQIEHETEVADASAVAAILGELGMSPRVVYEKRRKVWRLRSVEVVLDELAFGLYMEIEGSMTGIREAEMLLDIDHLEVEQSTYPRLTLELGSRNGDTIEARFPSSKERSGE